MDIRKLQRAIVDGLEDVKAQNIQVFNTEQLSPLFERVIVASGQSHRQTKALAASVRDAVKSRGMSVLRTEGEDNGEWIIVDCGAAVAHIMQPSIRDYYRLEEIWGGKPVHMKLGETRKGLVKASGDDEDDDELEAMPSGRGAAGGKQVRAHGDGHAVKKAQGDGAAAKPSASRGAKAAPAAKKTSPAGKKTSPAAKKASPAAKKGSPASRKPGPAGAKSSTAGTRAAPAARKTAPAKKASSPGAKRPAAGARSAAPGGSSTRSAAPSSRGGSGARPASTKKVIVAGAGARGAASKKAAPRKAASGAAPSRKTAPRRK
jgi:ribosome-associated protein